MDPSMRISDAERDHAVARLRDALGEGRLDMEGFYARLDGVYAAKTHGGVVPYLSDLPAPPNVKSSRRRRRRMSTYLGANVIVWSVWGTQVATGGSVHDLWPLWVSVPWGAWLFVNRLQRAPRLKQIPSRTNDS
jgi:hypothetical protein